MSSPSTSHPDDIPSTAPLRLATRLIFFLAGLGIACWAPLVPFAKDRIGLDEGQLGLMLLFLGVGSVLSMPIAGGLASKFGSRSMILSGAIGVVIMLPLLSLAGTQWQLAAALFLFGASLGAMDVAANIHGIEVEKRSARPLMSNFHGFYSVGGLAGSGAMTLLLSQGMSPFPAALSVSIAGWICIAIAAPRLLAIRPDEAAHFFVFPRGIVLLIGILTFLIFLIEGALLDWSAVLLKEIRGFADGRAGLGYFLFSVAMAIGRLTGDRITAKFGSTSILIAGSVLTSAGLAWAILAPGNFSVLFAFPIIGFGAANLVPVLYSAASRQSLMPKDLAISAISVMGYAGVLAGPAAIGFIAKFTGLPTVFVILSVAVLLVALVSPAFSSRNGNSGGAP